MMMATIQTGVRGLQERVKGWCARQEVRAAGKKAAWGLAGFALSAASLLHRPMPLAAGVVCGLSGIPAALVALGSAAGYMVYWGTEGVQCLVWTAAALIAALALGERKMTKAAPALLPAVAGLVAAGCGLGFQLALGDDTPVGIYFLRIALAAAAAWLTALVTQKQDPIPRWFACGFWVLALVQTVPIAWLNPGFFLAGFLGAGSTFPPAALAGLALDLARVTPASMTAALSLAWLLSLAPGQKPWMRYLSPGACCLAVMALEGCWQPELAIPLGLGGLARVRYPGQIRHRRRGETGTAQVRLEMAAGVMAQARQLLTEVQTPPPDRQALGEKCAQEACGGCSCRKSCQEKGAVPALAAGLLAAGAPGRDALPAGCRRPERLLWELRRGQEQLRLMESCRASQRESAQAVIQQYGFLANYLQGLSDQLSRRQGQGRVRFRPRVAVYANRRESENGDRCCWFAGTENRYYVVLCDGMGTGAGAVAEGNEAMTMVRRLLQAGFPAGYALRSLNSLCALRGRAGAVTVDVAELELETGKATLYKWGSPASWLLSPMGAEKLGTATPPPGLSLEEGRETVERLSLGRGDFLVLLSDGVGGEDAMPSVQVRPDMPPGEVAAEVLELGSLESGDDATVAVVRLSPA